MGGGGGDLNPRFNSWHNLSPPPGGALTPKARNTPVKQVDGWAAAPPLCWAPLPTTRHSQRALWASGRGSLAIQVFQCIPLLSCLPGTVLGLLRGGSHALMEKGSLPALAGGLGPPLHPPAQTRIGPAAGQERPFAASQKLLETSKRFLWVATWPQSSSCLPLNRCLSTVVTFLQLRSQDVGPRVKNTHCTAAFEWATLQSPSLPRCALIAPRERHTDAWHAGYFVKGCQPRTHICWARISTTKIHNPAKRFN